jgi:ElaB/YqjD/DUF883 family membrane-anchored ribosome-binding protein
MNESKLLKRKKRIQREAREASDMADSYLHDAPELVSDAFSILFCS